MVKYVTLNFIEKQKPIIIRIEKDSISENEYDKIEEIWFKKINDILLDFKEKKKTLVISEKTVNDIFKTVAKKLGISFKVITVDHEFYL